MLVEGVHRRLPLCSRAGSIIPHDISLYAPTGGGKASPWLVGNGGARALGLGLPGADGRRSGPARSQLFGENLFHPQAARVIYPSRIKYGETRMAISWDQGSAGELGSVVIALVKSGFRRPVIMSMLVALIMSISAEAEAFCPKNGFICLVAAKLAGSKTHQDITQQAIEDLDKSYFGVSAITVAMQRALEDIIEADAAVDDDQVTSAKHFDGENAVAAQDLIALERKQIITALQKTPVNSVGAARQNLGMALHTIQDFYSHSNWVEMGNVGANPLVSES
jgi:hypothetical protein